MVEVAMEVEEAPKILERDSIPSTISNSGYLDDDASLQATLQQLINQAQSTDSIAFKLPKWGALAGRVLAHSIQTLESLIQKHEPLIFKIGITHNPTWRWGNDLYGYVGAKDRWTHMLVFFAAGEPFSVAMLEASLIEKYQSISPAWKVKYVGASNYTWILETWDKICQVHSIDVYMSKGTAYNSA